MTAVKEKIKENLDFLSEEQLQELADFTIFLKVLSKIKNSKKHYAEKFSEFSNEDKTLADSGMADYNYGLLEKDKL